MTIRARSAVSFAVPCTVPDVAVAEARIPTYTCDARNRGFRASGRFGMSNTLSVVAPGLTSAVTPKAGVPLYTEVATESKYTWNVTLPVPVASTKDDVPMPRELIVCTGMVSGTPGGSGPRYGRVSALAELRKL